MPPLVPPAPMKKTRRVASRARAFVPREIVIAGRPVNGVYVSASVGDVNTGFSCKQPDSLDEARSTRRRQPGKAGERSATSVFANKKSQKEVRWTDKYSYFPFCLPDIRR